MRDILSQKPSQNGSTNTISHIKFITSMSLFSYF